ncbi:hypothetical protein L596_009651 [Steinernema carpocapsae]|uniref:Uncharacterized protein n=1 Tax=Steinernema carpocapsae TaxID=34508 RepID=A0A4U5PGH0_STECR|nr:hypothetical protein L596_009651 [Steinernema carpocapsae]
MVARAGRSNPDDRRNPPIRNHRGTPLHFKCDADFALRNPHEISYRKICAYEWKQSLQFVKEVFSAWGQKTNSGGVVPRAEVSGAPRASTSGTAGGRVSADCGHPHVKTVHRKY